MPSIEQIQAAFDSIADLPPKEQEQYLESHFSHDPDLISNVRSLLTADRAAAEDGFLQGSVLRPKAQDGSGHQLARYRLGRKLGEGGMGSVFLAEFEDEGLQRSVAIKILKRGLDTDLILKRFYKERHILANLEHPNLARVYDSGATADGLPFYVMEHINGIPLTQYCDAQNLGINAKLILFQQVCDAVSFAHRNLIVHRDIKPSNILVTHDGVVKLLDFGIAKILDPSVPSQQTLTAIDQRVMTPAYASPEQLQGGAMTTGSDVYSMGVLLFELLSGRQPFTEFDPASIARRTSGDTPKLNLSNNRQDLETIVSTAMRTAVSERYPSVDALRDDIERFLNGFPIKARPPLLSYRLKMFARRHQRALFATTLLIMTFLALVIGLAQQRQEAVQQRDRALKAQQSETMARRAEEQLSDFLLNLFSVADPLVSERTDPKARDLLDRAVTDLQKDRNLEPNLKLRFKTVMSSAYVNLGLFDEAINLLEKDVAQLQDTDYSLEKLKAVVQLATAKTRRGEYENALIMLQDAKGLVENNLHQTPPDIHAQVLELLAESQMYNHKLDEATTSIMAAQQIWLNLTGPDNPNLAHNIALQAMILEEAGKFTESEASHRRAIQLMERAVGKDHIDIAIQLNSFAIVLQKLDKQEEAEAAFLDAIQRFTDLLGPNNYRLAAPFGNLATLYSSIKKFDQAEIYFKKSLALNRVLNGEDSVNEAIVLSNLCMCYIKMERFVEAGDICRQSIDIFKAHDLAETPYTGLAKIWLGRSFAGLGKDDRAMLQFDNALEILRKAFGQEHPAVARVLYEQGMIWGRKGAVQKAQALLQQSLDIRLKVYGPDHKNTKESQTALDQLP